MRLTLFSRLFLAVLTSVLIVVVIMLTFVNWRFRSGYMDYLHAEEYQQLEQLADSLAQHYRVSESWQALRQQPRIWHELLQPITFEIRMPHHNTGNGRDARPGLPPPHHARPGPPRGDIRLFLADADQTLVMGNRRLHQRWLADEANDPSTSRLYEQPVLLAGQSIGVVVIAQKRGENELWAEAFLQHQLESLYWPTLGAGLLAFLVAAVMVRSVLRPVRLLQAGTKAMSAGELAQPVPVVTRDELGELTEQFNAMADNLARQQAMRQQWQTDIAHELRTPVAALRAEIEALLDGVRQPSHERMKSLHRSVMALGTLVDDLHQLALSDVAGWEHHPEALDLAPILDDVVFALESQFEQKGLELVPLPTQLSLPMSGDGARLYQLFSNLLANSLRYTDVPGVVEIQAEVNAGTVRVCIRDSAPGVGDEDLPRLFDRLYRVDRSRSRALGGSGLGLSVCQAIVTAHGGRIEAQHSPLGGLSVVVELPQEETK